MDFAKVLAELAAFLSGQQARFALAGAFAMQAHGMQRATQDIDFAVEEKAKPALLDFMSARGYELLRVSEGFSNHLHRDPALGRVDFIYLDPHTADVLFAAAVTTKLGDLQLLVPAPEHVAAMKVQAMKSDPSRLFREMADIQHLLELPGVDEQKVRGYFEQHGLLGRFDEIKAILRRDRDPRDAG